MQCSPVISHIVNILNLTNLVGTTARQKMTSLEYCSSDVFSSRKRAAADCYRRSISDIQIPLEQCSPASTVLSGEQLCPTSSYCTARALCSLGNTSLRGAKVRIRCLPAYFFILFYFKYEDDASFRKQSLSGIIYSNSLYLFNKTNMGHPHYRENIPLKTGEI
jgi:hypothetical protein